MGLPAQQTTWDVGRTLEKLVTHSPDGSLFTSFSRVLPTFRVVYCAGKPTERVVYCLTIRHWLALALFPLWIIESSLVRRNVLDKLKERKQVIIKQLLTSIASSTVERYILEIRKFFCWCQGFGVKVQLSFDCLTIAIYLSQCFQQSNSSASPHLL